MKKILRAKEISVRYNSEKELPAVCNVSLEMQSGTTIGLIGESGSGKSSFALALMGMLNDQAAVDGILFYGDSPLHALSENEWNEYRWKEIALVFQNGLDVLNPVLTIGEQIDECMARHTALSPAGRDERLDELLAMVGLGRKWKSAFPHQLSGGMRQKVLIAMALSCRPKVLIVDEPTMALDPSAKQQIVHLLLELQKKENFAMLLISHELQIIRQMSTRVMVMYAGSIVEEGETEDVLDDPEHPYTRGLVSSSPAINPYRDMWGIPGTQERTRAGECPFYHRCTQRIPDCRNGHPALRTTGSGRSVACARGGIVTVLEGTGLHKIYHVNNNTVSACRDCSIRVKSGEVAALVGESGSGKTTLAELLSGSLQADRGRIVFEGRQLAGNHESAKKRGLQMVFQDPLSATNGRLSIAEAIREPLDIIKEGSKSDRNEAVRKALNHVMLPDSDDFLSRPCHTLSGGQRQRVAIARSLVMRPSVLIADEISAMLDPSTGANILRLLKGLQNAYGFAMLFITHDIALAKKISDRVFVMHEGRIIEEGPVTRVLTHPETEYTKRLIAHAEGQWHEDETSLLESFPDGLHAPCRLAVQ